MWVVQQKIPYSFELGIFCLDKVNYLFPRKPPPPCGRSSIGRASFTVRLRPS